MTVETAIELLRNEAECVKLADTCDRDCGRCHLVKPAEDILVAYEIAIQGLKKLSAQPEPLTDKEQRIFLAAMGREEKVCEEVDRNHVREPYEDSLMRVCKEIRRKVKGALWT